jgi:hypothetical protein
MTDEAGAGNSIVKVQPPLEELSAKKEYGLSVLKGAIGAIPFAGTAINEVLFEARGRLKQERVNRFVAQVAADVAQLAAASIDHQYLQTEEFSDLVEDILLRVARTRSDVKKRHLRMVFVGALQGRLDVDFTDLFLVLLDQVTEHELHVLRGLSRYPLNQAADSEPVEMGVISYEDGLWGLSGEQAKQVVQALLSKGLLADTSHGYFGGKPFDRAVPTELGLRFLNWLGEGEGVEAPPSDSQQAG